MLTLQRQLKAQVARLIDEVDVLKALRNEDSKLIEELVRRVEKLEGKAGSDQGLGSLGTSNVDSAGGDESAKLPAPPHVPLKRREYGGGGEPCAKCGKTVYAAEKILAQGVILHRACFRCAHCDAKLVNSPNWEMLGTAFYCGPHFFQMQKTEGVRREDMMSTRELQAIIDRKISAAEVAFETGIAHLQRQQSADGQPL